MSGDLAQKKVSVGQCMAEILCQGDPRFSCADYDAWGERWNRLDKAVRDEVVAGLREYLVKQLGAESVED